MQFFWKHLHNNKGDENVSKLIWIVIAFVIGALLLSTMSVAFKTDGTGTISGWLNSSLENWFGEADGRDGSVSGGAGGSGGGNGDPSGPLEPPVTEKFEHSGKIPVGGTYYVGVTSNQTGSYTGNSVEVLSEGQEFPMPQKGDVYVYGDYEYRFQKASYMAGWVMQTDGWGVDTLNVTKEEYQPILESINKQPVTSLKATFYNCKSLKTAPLLPDSVSDMTYTFLGCTSLTEAPNIPQNVTDISNAFQGCTSLTEGPTIPPNVTNMSSTFSACTSLTKAPEIPYGVTNMNSTFYGCTSLTEAPVISYGVTNMSYTFYGCTSLTEAPVIPKSVTNVNYIFANCSALVNATTIPYSVTTMDYAFQNCTSLTKAPFISYGITSLNCAFQNCTSLTGEIEISALYITSATKVFESVKKPLTVVVNFSGSTYMTIFNACYSQSNITIKQEIV